MIDSMTEIPLTGGNVNHQVVRVGDTVRRATTPHSANVHALLRQLEHAGFKHAPRYLGMDDKGREILTFIPGETEFPATLWSDDTALISAARMLRQYHDASAEMVASHPTGWAYAYPDTSQHQVICHNDFAPYNMVFDHDMPVAIIDFDLAGPGPRLRDLAYLAYWMVPLSFSGGELTAASQADLANTSQRLKALCRAYGTDAYADLLNMVTHVVGHMGDPAAAEKMVGPVAAAKLAEGGHFDHWQREAAAFGQNHARVSENMG